MKQSESVRECGSVRAGVTYCRYLQARNHLSTQACMMGLIILVSHLLYKHKFIIIATKI